MTYHFPKTIFGSRISLTYKKTYENFKTNLVKNLTKTLQSFENRTLGTVGCSERRERWRRQHGDQHHASERSKSSEFSAAGRRRNVRNLVHTDRAGKPPRQRVLQQRTRTRYLRFE